MHKSLFFALFVATAIIHAEDIKNKNPRAALMIAAQRSKKKAATTPLLPGANSTLKNNQGNTRATTERKKGHWEIACVLDTNKKNKIGEIPLMTAARKGDKQVVLINLNYGADPTLKNPKGKTAAAIAREQAEAADTLAQANYLDIVYLINCHRFFSNTPQPKQKLYIRKLSPYCKKR